MDLSQEAPETPSRQIGIALLGSTGSVGRQTLEVIDRHPDRFRVVTLSGGSNLPLLRQQVARFRPELISIASNHTGAVDDMRHVQFGPDGLIAAATHPKVDIVVVATSGHAAIMPTYHAISAGKTIALANKETIVCAGELIMPFAREQGVEIRPVDSEHSAIWQSLAGSNGDDIARIILTASGGPFRKFSTAELATVTARDALRHPTYAMGAKITVDSALMMNKGLEVIEAHWLFSAPYNRIEVLIHPQSIVHSLVEFIDGSQIAQLGLPDMRLPIQYALSYPQRLPGRSPSLSLARVGRLEFAEPDLEVFPSLRLAREAGLAGATFPTVLSAADEVAVAAFTRDHLRFVEIPRVVEHVLDRHRPDGTLSFESIAAADEWATATAIEMIRQSARS